MSRPGDSIGTRPSGVALDDSVEVTSVSPADVKANRLTRLVLHGLSMILFAGLVAYVVRYGRNLFYWDDFELVFGLTGQQPTDLGWFFTWQNEHLVAMVRFVFFVVWHVTGDTRVMMLLICLGLFVSTALLLETARMARGRAVWTDAAIPLLLLNWGHYQNIIFPLQFFFAWAVALACACLWAFVRARDEWRLQELIVVLVAAPLLPLNGIFGLVFGLPFAALAIRTGLERAFAGDEHSRRDAVVLGIAALATIGTAILNVSGYRPVEHHPPADSIWSAISAVTEVLAVGVGPAGIETWPASGIAFGTLAAVALLVVAFARRQSTSGRRSAEAFAASLLGFGALVCAIGFGRAGLGPAAGFASRYSVFSAVLACVALVALTLAWQSRVRRILAIVVVAAVVAAQPLAFTVGRDYGRDMAKVSDRILGDLARGVPIEVVAHGEGTRIYPSGDALTFFLRALSASGRGAVGTRTKGQLPCSNEVRLAPRVEHANTMSWDGQVAECFGGDPFTVFALNAPVKVCAVRIRFRMMEPDGNTATAMMQGFWSDSARNSFDPGIRNQTFAIQPSSADVRTVTFWIGETIDRFRIDPNTRTCRFELLEFTIITQ